MKSPPKRTMAAGAPSGMRSPAESVAASATVGPARKTHVVVRLKTAPLRASRRRSRQGWSSGGPCRPAKKAFTRPITPSSSGAPSRKATSWRSASVMVSPRRVPAEEREEAEDHEERLELHPADEVGPDPLRDARAAPAGRDDHHVEHGVRDARVERGVTREEAGGQDDARLREEDPAEAQDERVGEGR